jgi:hypothetical protein
MLFLRSQLEDEVFCRLQPDVANSVLVARGYERHRTSRDARCCSVDRDFQRAFDDEKHFFALVMMRRVRLAIGLKPRFVNGKLATVEGLAFHDGTGFQVRGTLNRKVVEGIDLRRQMLWLFPLLQRREAGSRQQKGKRRGEISSRQIHWHLASRHVLHLACAKAAARLVSGVFKASD